MTQRARVKDRARELARGQGGEDEIVTLSTDVRVRLKAVSALLCDEMADAITEPKVPVVFIAAKEREEENPNDPGYIRAVRQYEADVADAKLDALIMFGVELVDGMPEDETWLRKLRWLAKRKGGKLDLAGFDLEDEFDLEFLYKKFVVVGGPDLRDVFALQAVRPKEVARHRRATFLGDAPGDGAGVVRAEGRDTDGDRDEPVDDGVGSGDGGES